MSRPGSAGAAAPPEPEAAQGEYNPAAPEEPLRLPEVAPGGSTRGVELLAPAGGPDAGYAAFHYGADAIYLGLKKFSARAEAENFDLEDVDAVTAFAHSLAPKRRVFVTVNTLILQHELKETLEVLAALTDIGVDAVIVQDLGVYGLVRRHFPDLELHASTQMAVHNRQGAQALRRMGFARVVLARELTFEEVREITACSGIETEVFVHGALCYSYSGLCLFSAQTIGRSGNRGKCAYTCRDHYRIEGAPETLRDGTPVRRDPARGFPFSMKDLALPDHVPALRDAGVSCFKIEGRKKSPLYVATTTGYYRKVLDDGLAAAERAEREADIQTVFSRPWTRLFVQSHKDKEVADRDATMHRGAPIGKVETVRGEGDGPPRLRFHTARRIERHDGLQVDLAGQAKPFGFAVERMWMLEREPGAKPRERGVYEAPAGSWVEVELPEDHPPLPLDAPVYCSSSQSVKQRYRFSRPRPGAFRSRKKVIVRAELAQEVLRLTATVPAREPDESLCVTREWPGPFESARDAAKSFSALKSAFEKLGETRLELGAFELHNPDALFVSLSQANAMRREIAGLVEERLEAARNERLSSISKEVFALPNVLSVPEALCWSIKVDRIAFLDEFEAGDWRDLGEVVVDIGADGTRVLEEKLSRLKSQLGAERVRLALPAITRKWEEADLARKVEHFRSAGWCKWEAANLSAWSFLGLDPLAPTSELDVSADWPLYVLNHVSGETLAALGVSRLTLSPEDGLGNMRALLARLGSRATIIVHQDTPLFIAESCAYANLIGGCPGKANCRFEAMDLVSSYEDRLTAVDYHCRTIVLNRGAYCLAPRLAELREAGASSVRADFIHRKYTPRNVRAAWQTLRAGGNVPGGHAANFDRGLL